MGEKQAYLIIANHKFSQLSFLISLLDNPKIDIFLFIDKKAKLDTITLNRLKQSVKFSNLIFTNRHKVYWGGYSLITAELELFKSAMQFDKYSFFHLISGVDLPITTQDKIIKFFDAHLEYNFMDICSKERFILNNVNDRVKYYHFFEQLNVRNFSGKFSKKLVRLYRKAEIFIQQICKIDLVKKFNLNLDYGSNWCSLNYKTVKKILDNERWIRKTFKYSILSDEVFIPTLFNKLDLSNSLYINVSKNRNPDTLQGHLRYINWDLGQPYTFTSNKSDLEIISTAKNTGHFWIRKFDIEEYPKIKDFILEIIHVE